MKLSITSKMLVLIGTLALVFFLSLTTAIADHDDETDTHSEELSIRAEVHGTTTHIHVDYADADEVTFWLDDHDISEEGEIITAVAEHEGLSEDVVSDAIVFKSDEHEHDEDTDGHDHATHDHSSDLSDSERIEKMQSLIAILQQLITLLTEQVEHGGTVDMDMHDSHTDHGDHGADEHSDTSNSHDDMDLSGIHIMGDGSVMLGDGTTLSDATVNDEGMIVLGDGTEVEPVMDMRDGGSMEDMEESDHDDHEE